MTNEYQRCTICPAGGHYSDSRDVARVHSNVREFAQQEFTVWRCPSCASLHCLEDIDYAHYYRAYPIKQTRLDFITRVMYRSRLQLLKDAGLSPTHRVLDYGCGNGAFVRYLHQCGYAAQGYDPYSTDYADAGALNPPYDFVLAQDVIEHDPDPPAFVGRLAAMVVRPGGALVIGTPDASGIQLNNALDACGQLHQPFHRHILARSELERLISSSGLHAITTVRRWYVDTWFPFANSSFLVRFWAALGGVIDVSFEPVPPTLLLRHPSLLWYGLFGRLNAPQKDMLVIGKAA